MLSPVTVTAQRVQEAMALAGIDQQDLADALGVSQGSISKIVQGKTRNSRLLPRIAHKLKKPLPYLLGETDDPDEASSKPSVQLPYQAVTLQVLLPSEPALARMFEGLLRAMDRSLPLEEQARLLAQRLPIGLSQLRDLMPTSAKPTVRVRQRRQPTRVPEPQP